MAAGLAGVVYLDAPMLCLGSNQVTGRDAWGVYAMYLLGFLTSG